MFKIGDKVFIDPNSNFNVPFWLGFTRGMENYIGRTATVTAIISSEGYREDVVALDIDRGRWQWAMSWLKHYDILNTILTSEEIDRINNLNHA